MSGPTMELLRGGLQALRRSSAWWCASLLGLVVVTLAFWPSLQGSNALDALDEVSGSLLRAFGAQGLASPSGYLDGELFALMLPMVLAASAIAGVTALTSGDEDAGRMEILQALPVDRRSSGSHGSRRRSAPS